VLNHDTDGLWSGLKREHGTDFNAELIFAPSVEFLHGTLRPAAGGTVNTSGYTSKIYACGRWEREFRNGAFAALGLGVAWHDGETEAVAPDRKALGSPVLFHIPVELGYVFNHRHSVSIYFDHMSNAGLAEENEGMDTLGVRYGVRF
jgi:hypothetical protein